MGVNWVQTSSVKDVVVAWRRRMKNSWVSCVWKMIPFLFGGVLGRKGTIGFLSKRPCPIKFQAIV